MLTAVIAVTSASGISFPVSTLLCQNDFHLNISFFFAVIKEYLFGVTVMTLLLIHPPIEVTFLQFLKHLLTEILF